MDPAHAETLGQRPAIGRSSENPVSPFLEFERSDGSPRH
jgi:hypothetical protein